MINFVVVLVGLIVFLIVIGSFCIILAAFSLPQDEDWIVYPPVKNGYQIKRGNHVQASNKITE